MKVNKETKTMQNKAYSDTEKAFDHILKRMVADTQIVGRVGNIGSKVFSYGIQIMIFGPLLISVLAKYYPKIGRIYDSFWGESESTDYRDF